MLLDEIRKRWTSLASLATGRYSGLKPAYPPGHQQYRSGRNSLAVLHSRQFGRRRCLFVNLWISRAQHSNCDSWTERVKEQLASLSPATLCVSFSRTYPHVLIYCNAEHSKHDVPSENHHLVALWLWRFVKFLPHKISDNGTFKYYIRVQIPRFSMYASSFSLSISLSFFNLDSLSLDR